MSESTVCPNCGAAVEGGTGFGMVACPKCGEFVLLGSDQPKPALHKASEAGLTDEDPGGADGGLSPSTTILDLDLGAQEQEEEEFVMTAPPSERPKTEESRAEDFQAVAPQSTAENNIVLPPVPPPQFKDVVEFGNQDLPSVGFGALVYDLKIGGIDTAEIREELSQCIQDFRLQLDLNETMAKIKDGELVLEQINPVKASVLLNRLRHLPFKISWSSRQLIKGVKALLVLLFIPFVLLCSRPAGADDWARHQVNLKDYATKIHNMEEDIRGLIKKKNHENDPDKRDAMLKDIVAKHQDLMKLYREFKAEKEAVLFEYPAQGDQTERKYRHIRPKSIAELENEPGLDGQLTRIKAKIDDTYGAPGTAAATPSPAPSGKKK